MKNKKMAENTPIDYRQQAFSNKFGQAALCLGVRPDQIVSLKMRDCVNSYQHYRDLVEILEREAGFSWSSVDGDLQGKGYLLQNDKSKVILVEHETGLEILYIAGSIASLVSVIPVILSCWRSIRGRSDRANRFDSNHFEIRRLDNSGHLRENHANGMHGFRDIPIECFNTVLTSAAILLENEMKGLVEKVSSLESRVAILEKQKGKAVAENSKSKVQKSKPHSKI
jgi:hypothetical protein